jgi:trimeric autotransporter adhesin
VSEAHDDQHVARMLDDIVRRLEQLQGDVARLGDRVDGLERGIDAKVAAAVVAETGGRADRRTRKHLAAEVKASAEQRSRLDATIAEQAKRLADIDRTTAGVAQLEARLAGLAAADRVTQLESSVAELARKSDAPAVAPEELGHLGSRIDEVGRAGEQTAAQLAGDIAAARDEAAARAGDLDQRIGNVAEQGSTDTTAVRTDLAATAAALAALEQRHAASASFAEHRMGELDQAVGARIAEATVPLAGRVNELDTAVAGTRSSLDELRSHAEQVATDARTRADALSAEVHASAAQVAGEARTRADEVAAEARAQYEQVAAEARAQTEQVAAEAQARTEQVATDARAQYEQVAAEAKARTDEVAAVAAAAEAKSDAATAAATAATAAATVAAAAAGRIDTVAAKLAQVEVTANGDRAQLTALTSLLGRLRNEHDAGIARVTQTESELVLLHSQVTETQTAAIAAFEAVRTESRAEVARLDKTVTTDRTTTKGELAALAAAAAGLKSDTEKTTRRIDDQVVKVSGRLGVIEAKLEARGEYWEDFQIERLEELERAVEELNPDAFASAEQVEAIRRDLDELRGPVDATEPD